MAVIAICIRLDSPGPILFRQRRLGYEMRPFTVLKFRTMRVDTDQDVHRRYIETTRDAPGLAERERPLQAGSRRLGHAGRPVPSQDEPR